MRKRHSVLLLALILIGCASTQPSAARTFSGQQVAQAAQVCPTVEVICVAMTVTPGASATPTRSITTPAAAPSATVTALATVTNEGGPTPTRIVQGATWTPAAPVRYGLYTPYNQQRVRACASTNDSQCPRIGWIGGGSTWAV